MNSKSNKLKIKKNDIYRKWMTAIVIDEGTSVEKLYMGGGYGGGALGPTSLEKYPKLLAVYDTNSKTWR